MVKVTCQLTSVAVAPCKPNERALRRNKPWQVVKTVFSLAAGGKTPLGTDILPSDIGYSIVRQCLAAAKLFPAVSFDLFSWWLFYSFSGGNIVNIQVCLSKHGRPCPSLWVSDRWSQSCQ
ncbi:hypothetical protein DPEC_G00124990 [Dallia pectoralis]|uniref:Uncharacterized protein n=1 Tax=Dallia pectoralis TaxID=75939 RepID=A0ACC2GR06_DALPE|nr:hypothetical protein DPEC_G00124990 [Dallia pectoralis]